MNVAPNGNRAARRAAGQRAARPPSDLSLTRVAGSVFLGFTGAGNVRLTPVQARQLAAELLELADAAQGDLS